MYYAQGPEHGRVSEPAPRGVDRALRAHDALPLLHRAHQGTARNVVIYLNDPRLSRPKASVQVRLRVKSSANLFKLIQ